MAVEEMKYNPEDYAKLRYAFPGLDDAFLVLVWDLAVFLMQLQSSIERWETAKRN